MKQSPLLTFESTAFAIRAERGFVDALLRRSDSADALATVFAVVKGCLSDAQEVLRLTEQE